MDKPSSPRVLGILSIVFGAIVIAFSLFGLVSNASGLGVGALRGHEAALAHYMERLQPMATIMGVLMLAMSGALLWIGIGQRAYRRWARSASLVWGAVALVVLAAQFYWQITAAGPALTEFMTDLGLSTRVVGSGLGQSMGFVTLFFYLPYPIILLVFFRRPSIVAAMDR